MEVNFLLLGAFLGKKGVIRVIPRAPLVILLFVT